MSWPSTLIRLISRSVAACLVLAPAVASAGPLEELVMPGQVSQAHAKWEKECASCHAAFDRGKQRELCLDCHTETAADVRSKTGFHGRSRRVGAAPCSTCHGEHKGRGGDIVGLAPETFDHRETDHPLHGAHARVPCGACHEQNEPYREAKHACIDCHRSDDRHRGAMGTKCADCHEESSWRGGRFDHDETKFPLRDAHAKTACAACHPGEKYEQTPRDCASCHAVDDFHRGTFGRDCASCHSTAAWKKRGFDHAKNTRFPLTGSHAQTPCLGCHVGGVDAKRKPRMDCLDCHRSDDDHRGRNGAACADCHGTSAWKPARFDHAKTDFPLRGLHADVPCASCHTGEIARQQLAAACASCHRADDPHAGKQGDDCARCHSESGWRSRVRFDHDLTKFPLLGLHATVACEECHASRVYADADPRCVACHRAQDAHERKLGPACARCHNPAGWTAWRFDHDAQTEFALHGSHEDVACTSCHTTPSDGKIALRRDCAACHTHDDEHDGRFGRDCARCHTETRWRDVRIR